MIDASLSSETLARTEIDELAGVLLARGEGLQGTSPRTPGAVEAAQPKTRVRQN